MAWTRWRRSHVAEPVQQIGHPQRHRRLPGARLTGEAHVQVRPRRGQAEPQPHPVDEQQRGDLLDLLLDRDEADKLAVQGGQDVVDAGDLALLRERDGRVRIQQRLTALPGARIRRGGARPGAGSASRPGRPGRARRPERHASGAHCRARRPAAIRGQPLREGVVLVGLPERVAAEDDQDHDEGDAGDEDQEQHVRQVLPGQRQRDRATQKHYAQFEMLGRYSPHDVSEVNQAASCRSSGPDAPRAERLMRDS